MVTSLVFLDWPLTTRATLRDLLDQVHRQFDLPHPPLQHFNLLSEVILRSVFACLLFIVFILQLRLWPRCFGFSGPLLLSQPGSLLLLLLARRFLLCFMQLRLSCPFLFLCAVKILLFQILWLHLSAAGIPLLDRSITIRIPENSIILVTCEIFVPLDGVLEAGLRAAIETTYERLFVAWFMELAEGAVETPNEVFVDGDCSPKGEIVITGLCDVSASTLPLNIIGKGWKIPIKGLLVCKPFNILMGKQRLAFWTSDFVPELGLKVVLDALR